MSLQYQNLDARTRPHMSAELNADQAAGRLYISPRLNEAGAKIWATLLGEAIAAHDDAWLAVEIRNRGLLKSHEERRKPKGGDNVSASADERARNSCRRRIQPFLCSRPLPASD